VTALAVATLCVAAVAAVATLAAGRAAAAVAGGAGTAGGTAIGVGGSARSLGMGGAGLADLRDAGAVWANPARLAALAAPELSFMHGAYVQGVSLEQLAVGGPTRWGALGGGVTLLRVGSIDSYEAGGASSGVISPSEQAVSAGWAWPGGTWSAGAAATWYRSQLAADAKADAFAGDVGASVTPVPMLSLAAAVQHLGTGLDYGGKTAALPMTIRGGAAVTLADLGLVVAADGVMPSDGNLSIRVGAEKGLVVRSDVSVAVRAGWRSSAPAGGVSGLAAGAEVLWHPAGGFNDSDVAGIGTSPEGRGVTAFRLIYAWTPLGELGAAHWFAVALSF
jgi:hypothetical protein